MTDVSQIARDHGVEARAAIAAVMTRSTIVPLVDGVDLEDQLKQARRVVCTPGTPNPACAKLVDMSLRLANDPYAEAIIRAEYAGFMDRFIVTFLAPAANVADEAGHTG
jgi:hypothetical protein